MQRLCWWNFFICLCCWENSFSNFQKIGFMSFAQMGCGGNLAALVWFRTLPGICGWGAVGSQLQLTHWFSVILHDSSCWSVCDNYLLSIETNAQNQVRFPVLSGVRDWKTKVENWLKLRAVSFLKPSLEMHFCAKKRHGYRMWCPVSPILVLNLWTGNLIAFCVE